MQRSRDRFLTTHTGSLPRPDDLIRMMYAKEEGIPVDPAALAARVKAAVAEVVKKQADAGVDLINDGETSKPSYATYIKDRLDGFGGPSFIRTSPSSLGWRSACSAIPAARAAKHQPAMLRLRFGTAGQREPMRTISRGRSPT